LRSRGAVHESIPLLVVAEQTSAGSIVLSLVPTGERTRLSIEPATLAVVLWRVDVDVIRISLRNPRTGRIAYAQGTDELATFAGELGLRLERCSA
jgi:hypothetical protein